MDTFGYSKKVNLRPKNLKLRPILLSKSKNNLIKIDTKIIEKTGCTG
jgi:hypothetical protein